MIGESESWHWRPWPSLIVGVLCLVTGFGASITFHFTLALILFTLGFGVVIGSVISWYRDP